MKINMKFGFAAPLFLGVSTFLAVSSMPATAQLASLFSVPNNTQVKLKADLSSTLPPCPPLINGEPEFSNDSVWSPGLNCTVNPAATSAASVATGAPLDTLGGNAAQGDAPIGGFGGQTGGFGAYGNDTFAQASDAFSDVQGRIGLSYTSWPDYMGADIGRARGSILLDLTFADNGFLNNDDGLGWRIVSLGALEGKISLNWNGEQLYRDDTDGIGRVSNHFNFEADLVYSNLGLDYELEFVRPLTEVRGWTLTGSVGSEIPMDTGILRARAGLTYASKDWMESYYGISNSESVASGLTAYSPGEGLRDMFAEVGVEVPIGDTWGLDLGAGVRRVLGPVASSPQVQSAGTPIDYSGHVGVYYQF